jgi:RNA polymerase sigma-70 factor (ECF subfamily)
MERDLAQRYDEPAVDAGRAASGSFDLRAAAGNIDAVRRFTSRTAPKGRRRSFPPRGGFMAQHNGARTGQDPRGAPAEEARLLARVALGDARAFDALFRRYRPRLRRYLGAHMRRPELVDEIVNDTMLVVWRRARAFDITTRVSTWIIGIAARTGLKAAARANRHVAADASEAADAEESPEHAASRGERRRRLRAAIASLGPEHRAVLELAYFQGLSCREAAVVLRCPVDTVKTRMFHARRRLRTLLPDLEENAA